MLSSVEEHKLPLAHALIEIASGSNEAESRRARDRRNGLVDAF